MSFFARLWSRIRSPVGFIGRDLEGNRFYEYTSKHVGGRTRRVVKYRTTTEPWESAARLRTLPAQWTSWLSHTRSHAPTVTELQADMARIRRVLHNAAILDARDRDEQRFQALEAAAGRSLASPQAHAERDVSQEQLNAPETQESSPSSSFAKAEAKNPESDPALSVWDKPRQDEPEAWTPRIVNRGRS